MNKFNPYFYTFKYYMKLALSNLAIQVFLRNYCDLNKTSATGFMIIHILVGTMAYEGFSYFLTWLKNSDYMEQYKVKDQRVFKEAPQLPSLKEYIEGELYFLLICTILHHFVLKNNPASENLLYNFLFNFAVIFVEDILFYTIHRFIFHHPKFYWIHKLHHQEINTNGYSAQVDSLQENSILFIMDIFLFIIFGNDKNQFIAWIIMGTFYNVEGHCCVGFFLYDSDFHVRHHLNQNKNYGTTVLYDYLFGTLNPLQMLGPENDKKAE